MNKRTHIGTKNKLSPIPYGNNALDILSASNPEGSTLTCNTLAASCTAFEIVERAADSMKITATERYGLVDFSVRRVERLW